MNASINYSGFVDLLPTGTSENSSFADQKSRESVEPTLDTGVEEYWQLHRSESRHGTT